MAPIFSPLIKVCANPKARFTEDMDVNAGTILSEGTTLAQGLSEALGHRESVLLYKGEMAAKTLCEI